MQHGYFNSQGDLKTVFFAQNKAIQKFLIAQNLSRLIFETSNAKI